MNLLQQLEQEQVDKLAASRPVPGFQPGDTLRVGVKVVEGERERIQVFEGVCIGRKNAGVNSNFTLRKIGPEEKGRSPELGYPARFPAPTRSHSRDNGISVAGLRNCEERTASTVLWVGLRPEASQDRRGHPRSPELHAW